MGIGDNMTIAQRNEASSTLLLLHSFGIKRIGDCDGTADWMMFQRIHDTVGGVKAVDNANMAGREGVNGEPSYYGELDRLRVLVRKWESVSYELWRNDLPYDLVHCVKYWVMTPGVSDFSEHGIVEEAKKVARYIRMHRDLI